MSIRIIFSFCLAAILSCALDIPNPVFEDYKGDYRYTLTWSSPDSVHGDTFEVFRPYSLHYRSTGKDTFTVFKVSTTPVNVVDSSWLKLTNYNGDTSPARTSDSSVVVYFKDRFTGSLLVQGMRPNLKSVDTSISVVVVNPYRIVATYPTANMVSIAVTDSVPVQSDTALRVLWYVNGSRVDSLPYNKPYRTGLGQTATLVVAAVLCDNTGARLALDSILVDKTQNTIPSVSFADALIRVPVGKDYTVSALAANADSLRWQSRRLLKDTTTTVPQITWIWNDSTPDTVIVTSKNRAGITGNTDTLVVRPQSYTYDLNVISFPSVVKAKRWTTWEVAATRNGIAVPATEVVYVWTTSPDKAWDSIRTTGGKRELYFSQELSNVKVTVLGVIGIDSTWLKSTTFAVTADRPLITIAAYPPQIPVQSVLALVAHAQDTNAGGSVKTVYYRSSSDTVRRVLSGDTLRLTPATPGTLLISLWCVDNEGFMSDTAKATVLVTASKPYFERTKVDTVVFVNDSLRLNAKAFAGSTGDSLVSWKWDTDNNGTWDRTTTKGYVDTLFSTTGTKTVRVWCANSQGDSAETLSVITVKVVAGAPVVDSVKLGTTTTYVNKAVSVRLFAHDTNGVVKALSVSWGQATPLQVTTNKKVVDTTISVSFPTAGTYTFTISATDEDGQTSSLLNVKDSLIVDIGTPRVKGLVPDTLWLGTDTLLSITAEDNGSISGYAVSYNNAVFSAWSADSTFRHTFSDSGKQYVYLKVKDEDNIVSTVLKDSVFVKAGYPVLTGIALSVAADSLFVLDTRGFMVTATDPNKTVRKILVNWNGGTTAQDSADVNGSAVSTTINHAFALADSGSKTVKVWCRDDDGLLSAVASKLVQVRVARPVVSGVVRDSAIVYINDLVKYTIAATDTNGTISKAYADWGNDGAADDSVTVTGSNPIQFTHSFLVSAGGVRAIKYWVRDDDGLMSNAFNDTVTVRLGKPVIVTISPDSIIFINDTRQFTIATFDTNGVVDSVKIDNGSGTFGAFVKTTNGSYTLNKVFSRLEVGNKTIRIIAKDNDGVLSDTARLSIDVRLGSPVADSLQLPNIVWINDNNNYQIFAHDTNGTISKYFFDWSNSGTWQDSSTNGSAPTQFLSAGLKTIRYGVRDNDTLLTTATQQVMVHLGMPRVWNDGDTLFSVCPAGGGDIKIGISSFDTNGTILKYYWDFFGPPFDTSVASQYKTSVDSITQTITSPAVDIAQKLAVFGKDDDALVAGDTMWLYPDAPPPAPSFSAWYSGTGNTLEVRLDTTEFDIKERQNTEVLIEAGPKNPGFTVRDTLLAWQAASTLVAGGNKRVFSFDKSAYETRYGSVIYIRVSYRDKRGSVTSNPVTATY